MPNPVMFSNEQALRRGIERAKWKVDMGYEYLDGIDYNLKKTVFFDHREVVTIAALLIDISPVANATEEEKKAYYFEAFKRFEEEFILSNNETRKARFMQRLCDNLATSIEIDWDDEAAIEHLALSHKALQAPGTTVQKIPFEVLSMYSTKEEVQRIDGINIKCAINVEKFSNALASKYPALAELIGSFDGDSPDYRLRIDVAKKMQEAIDNGTNQVIIEPAESETIKKLLFGDEFRVVDQKPVRSDPGTFIESSIDEREAAKTFMEAFYLNSGSTVNEHMTIVGYRENKEKMEEKRADLLFINGRPMSEIIKEKNTELGHNGYIDMDALKDAGKVLRDALCDGQSVVSVMRPNMLPGGRIVFTHQEIKVNLDKLNELERSEKHNVFRRILDYFGIWKIQPKYPSNEQREAMQAEFKSSAEYRNSIKAAEKKFIDTYNENSRRKRAEEDELQKTSKDPVPRDKLFQAFPEVSNAADDRALDDNINEPVNYNNNDLARVPLPNIIGELEDDKNIGVSSPIIADDENAKEIEVNNIK